MPVPEIRRLDSFTVTVVDRGATAAIIQWGKGDTVYKYKGDTVKFNIKINGRFADSNLIRFRDTLTNLSPDTTYYGRVYAFTKGGDTASAPFILEYVKGYIFFGDIDQTIVCYDLYYGQKVWQSEVSIIGRFLGLPTIVNNVLYANNANSGTWALDARTGIKKWNTNYYVAGYPTGSQVNPLWFNGRLYTTMPDGIYALNANTGDTIWRYPSVEEFGGNPLLAGNILITSTNFNSTRILALHTETGSKIWERDFSSAISKNPVLYNDLVLFCTSDGWVYALKTSTGEVAWSNQLNFSSGYDYTSPILYKNLVILHLGGRYVGMNAADGAIVWSYAIQAAEISSPAIGNDLVYFTTPGIAYALKAGTGELVWQQAYGPADEWSTPICVKTRLYLGHTFLYGNGVHVLSAATGEYLGAMAGDANQWGLESIVQNDSTYYLSESGMLQ